MERGRRSCCRSLALAGHFRASATPHLPIQRDEQFLALLSTAAPAPRALRVTMKLSLVLAALALVAGVVHADTADCTTTQKQKVNSLLSTSSGKGKSCYESMSKQDITELSTSKLCTVEECQEWLAAVADSAPDCYYDETNYSELYAKKLADCPSSGSGSTASSKSADAGSASSSSASSSSSNSTSHATDKSSSSDGDVEVGTASSSSSSEDLDVDTIETPEPTKEDTTVETLAPSSGDDSTSASAEGSGSNGAASLAASSLVGVVALALSATL